MREGGRSGAHPRAPLVAVAAIVPRALPCHRLQGGDSPSHSPSARSGSSRRAVRAWMDERAAGTLPQADGLQLPHQLPEGPRHPVAGRAAGVAPKFGGSLAASTRAAGVRRRRLGESSGRDRVAVNSSASRRSAPSRADAAAHHGCHLTSPRAPRRRIRRVPRGEAQRARPVVRDGLAPRWPQRDALGRIWPPGDAGAPGRVGPGDP